MIDRCGLKGLTSLACVEMGYLIRRIYVVRSFGFFGFSVMGRDFYLSETLAVYFPSLLSLFDWYCCVCARCRIYVFEVKNQRLL